MLAWPAKNAAGKERAAPPPVRPLEQNDGVALGIAIGVQIRTLRRALDMTAGQLAERAGVSGSMLSKIERGLASRWLGMG